MTRHALVAGIELVVLVLALCQVVRDDTAATLHTPLAALGWLLQVAIAAIAAAGVLSNVDAYIRERGRR